MLDFENMTVQQRLEQFDTKHGNDCVRIGGFLVFSDGAMRDAHPLGPLYKPPFDPQEKLRVQIQYQEEMLRRAVENFEEYKHRMTLQAQGNLAERDFTPPPPSAIEHVLSELKRLKFKVWQMSTRLEDLKEGLDSVKPERQKMFDATNQANRESNAKFLEAISQLEV